MGESSEVADRDYRAAIAAGARARGGLRHRRTGLADLHATCTSRRTMFRTSAFRSSTAGRRRCRATPIYGLASNRTTADDDIATARYQHDFSPTLSLADTLRYAHYDFDYQCDACRISAANVPRPGDAAGRHPGRARRARQLRRADAISTSSSTSPRTSAPARHAHAGHRPRGRAPDLGSRPLSSIPSTPTTTGSRRPRCSTPTRRGLAGASR